MRLSVELAREYFKLFNRPRRVRDVAAERFHFEKCGKLVKRYRKVHPDESDRGEEYPVFSLGWRAFSHFGIGVGIYFAQLPLFALIYLLGGIVLIPSMISFYNRNKLINPQGNSLLLISGFCQPAIAVNATSGCPYGEAICTAMYRPNCELPSHAGILDLVFCFFLIGAILVNRFAEYNIEKLLDEEIQTAQDYSVEVRDPDADATEPDEWFEYFSRWGRVKYVSVIKMNSSLLGLLAEKHEIMMSIGMSSVELNSLLTMSTASNNWSANQQRWLKKLQDIEARLVVAYKQRYDACRVYVTFETEEEQGAVLRELEVPNIEAILDRPVAHSKAFRGVNTLDVVEPAEPDNILWHNVEIGATGTSIRRFLAGLLTLGLLLCSYYAVTYSSQASSTSVYVLPVVVGVLDTVFPTLFNIITTVEGADDEGKRQESLQEKLFFARILLSTVFPYTVRSFLTTLDETTVSGLVNVQLTTCFIAPIQNLIDAPNIIARNVVAPLFAVSQQDLNSRWRGSKWALAERYTGIIKIMFNGTFYALLIPSAMFIASIAFVAYFLIDKFLLFRRWAQPPLMGSDIAKRLGRQLLLSIAVHMIVTSRYLYSWPFDEVYVKPDGSYQKVDKQAPLNLLELTQQEPFHNHTANLILTPYVAMTVLVCALTIYAWVVLPVYDFCRGMFFHTEVEKRSAGSIEFSKVEKIFVYVPRYFVGSEEFLCADTSQMLVKHMPFIGMQINSSDPRNHNVTVMAADNPVTKSQNLGDYVPLEYRRRVLSVVKWYGKLAFEKRQADRTFGTSTTPIPPPETDPFADIELQVLGGGGGGEEGGDMMTGSIPRSRRPTIRPLGKAADKNESERVIQEGRAMADLREMIQRQAKPPYKDTRTRDKSTGTTSASEFSKQSVTRKDPSSSSGSNRRTHKFKRSANKHPQKKNVIDGEEYVSDYQLPRQQSYHSDFLRNQRQQEESAEAQADDKEDHLRHKSRNKDWLRFYQEEKVRAKAEKDDQRRRVFQFQPTLSLASFTLPTTLLQQQRRRRKSGAVYVATTTDGPGPETPLKMPSSSGGINGSGVPHVTPLAVTTNKKAVVAESQHQRFSAIELPSSRIKIMLIT